MRIRVLIKASNIETYPQHVNYYLNTAIYGFMTKGNKALADKIHETGYVSDTKAYRPFCFCRPRFDNIRTIENENKSKTILVAGYGRWLISSPFDEIIEAIVDGMAKTDKFKIGEAEFSIEEIATEPEPKITENEIVFWAVSPIVATIADPEKKQNIFLSPLDERFYDILANNAKRKLKLLTNKEYDIKFSMYKPEKYNHNKSEKVSRYCKGLYKGYLLPFKITGNPEALRLLYDWGIGSYNSQGYGMVSTRPSVV